MAESKVEKLIKNYQDSLIQRQIKQGGSTSGSGSSGNQNYSGYNSGSFQSDLGEFMAGSQTLWNSMQSQRDYADKLRKQDRQHETTLENIRNAGQIGSANVAAQASMKQSENALKGQLQGYQSQLDIAKLQGENDLSKIQYQTKGNLDIAKLQNAGNLDVARMQTEASKYGAKTAADASKYGSAQAADASKYGSAQAAEASKFGSLQSRYASEYGAAMSADASKFGSSQAALASIFGSAQEAEASKYSARMQADASKFGSSKAAEASMFGAKQAADASRFAATTGAEADRYAALKGYQGVLAQTQAQRDVAGIQGRFNLRGVETQAASAERIAGVEAGTARAGYASQERIAGMQERGKLLTNIFDNQSRRQQTNMQTQVGLASTQRARPTTSDIRYWG